MLGDLLVLVGFALVIAGVTVVFGAGWALIIAGTVFFAAGARLQTQQPVRTEKRS